MEYRGRTRLLILQGSPFCNINCDYCYLRNRDDRTVMSADVLGAIRDKIFPRISEAAAPAIIWHAGEPTAVPIAWYRHAYAELRRTAPPHAPAWPPARCVATSTICAP